MQSLNAARVEIQRPPILEVITQYLDLRPIGRESWGLCPLHAEKTPSFAVNVEKEVFYCHGCHAGGDVIAFVQKIDGVDFKTAVKRLGLEEYRPSAEQIRIKRNAQTIAEWANRQTVKANAMLREIGERQELTQELNWAEELEDLQREWNVLEALADDLQDQTAIMELWRERETVENILADAPQERFPSLFPALTDQYKARLASYAEGYVG